MADRHPEDCPDLKAARRTHHETDDGEGARSNIADRRIPAAPGPPARYNYKPLPLRRPFLAALMFVILSFIALTQYACHSLPLEGNRSDTWETTSGSSPGRTTPYARIRRDDPPFAQNATGTVDRSTITPSSKRPPAPGGNRGQKTASEEDPGAWATDGQVTITSTSPGSDGAARMTALLDRPGGAAPGATTVNRVAVVETGVATLKGVTSTIVVTAVIEGAVVPSTLVTLFGDELSTFTSTATPNGDAPLEFLVPRPTTLTDAHGSATATITSAPAAVWLFTPTVVTLKNADGVPTATVTTIFPAEPITLVLTDAAGEPTATVTRHPAAPGEPGQRLVVSVYSISKLEYFTGFFVPPLLSVCLTILVRVLDLNVKQFQPFHELAAPDGSPASASLCLQTTGFHGLVASFRSLLAGKALVFLTTVLLVCSAFLVPISSEAVALKLHGACAANSFKGCAMTLGVFPGPAKATTALLGVMAGLVLLIAVSLARWRTGIASNPWSIAGIACLSTDAEVRSLLAGSWQGRNAVKNGQVASSLGPVRFRLQPHRRGAVLGYGIAVHKDELGRPLRSRGTWPAGFGISKPKTTAFDRDRTPRKEETRSGGKGRGHLPYLMLAKTGRGVFLFFLFGLIVVVSYYNATQDDTPFEAFMDNQSFGVRFLFTAVGICITFFWSSFFTNVATLSPYCLLYAAPQTASRSILLRPPTHALTGLWSAARRRHVYLSLVAVAAVLAEFMPILLNNVPFRVTQTFITHEVCTWLAVSILLYMLLVVLGSFLVKWPNMPADPSTIAGAMYYICDSGMLDSMEGVSMLGDREQRSLISDRGLRYRWVLEDGKGRVDSVRHGPE